MPGFPVQFSCSPKSSPVAVPGTDSELLYSITEILRIIAGSVPGPGEAAGSKEDPVLALLGDGPAPRASCRREHAHRVPGGREGARFGGASMQGPAGAKALSGAEGLEGRPCGQHGTGSGPEGWGAGPAPPCQAGRGLCGKNNGETCGGRAGRRTPWRPWLPGVRPHGKFLSVSAAASSSVT